MTCQLVESNQCFGGMQHVYTHHSQAIKADMRFGLFLPPAAEKHSVPLLFWLSGLTCSEQNFITKAGAQRVASELGLALVIPDTSPRGLNLPGQQEGLGEGAGFYVDATREPWAAHYQMYTYISKELPQLLSSNFSIDKQRIGILGHSMGGHGALTIGIKNPQLFRSLSAFAPICAPTQSPWGIMAFENYLGPDKALWKNYDACDLIRERGWPHGEILIDQGSSDPFLSNQLKPELFMSACNEACVSLKLRSQKNYGHNYYFIATFIEEHLRFHAQMLQG